MIVKLANDNLHTAPYLEYRRSAIVVLRWKMQKDITSQAPLMNIKSVLNALSTTEGNYG